MRGLSFRTGNITQANQLKEVKEVSFDCDDDGKPVSLITGKEPYFGVDPVIKTFYEGRKSTRNGFDWVETPPKQLSVKKTMVYDRVAIKVYKIKDHEQPTMQGRTPLKIHMIDVQNPHLIAALKPILEPVGVFLEVHNTAHFMEPFRPLYFCYDEIRTLYHKKKSDSILGTHLRLLLSVLSELFDGLRAQLRNLRDSNLISFSLAWTYFARGSTVYSHVGDTELLIRVEDTYYDRGTTSTAALKIRGEQLAFDGSSFEWKSIIVRIPSFEGNVPVTELPHFPLSFHPNPESVKARLAKRGRKALEYQDVTLRECEGVGITESIGCRSKCTVSGRVIIDFYGYQKYHKGLERMEKPQENGRVPNSVPNYTSDGLSSVDGGFPRGVGILNPGNDQATSNASNAADVYVQRLSQDKQDANKRKLLSKQEELAFISPELYGYSLKAKLWLQFHIDDMRPVQWNDEAYEHLVYPAEQKDLVLSFVQNHRSSLESTSLQGQNAAGATGGTDDVILGKGRGLVILLSGPPGTGKTLTAEATADQTRRPLFSLHAEDLGTNAAALGAALKRAFAMAADWNAVVLLDEADVFMAVRQVSDVARNELVSIFLRELEYFAGTIFLTTNLLQNIDAAFRSRVDIHLLFNPLPQAAREVLWRKFLARLPPTLSTVKVPGSHAAGAAVKDSQVPPARLVSDADFRSLARWDLNGREIKNAVKTVRTWCACKAYPMDLARLEAGIRVTAPLARKLRDGEVSRQGQSTQCNWEGDGGWGDAEDVGQDARDRD